MNDNQPQKLTRRWRPAFPGEGPKTVSAEPDTSFYTPDRAAREEPSSAILYRDDNTRAALERRCGFPSYLTQRRPN